MVKLRDYQEEVIEKITGHFKKQRKQYVQMPTGSGKTVTFLAYASKNHKRVMVVVPSKELLNQVYETAQLFYHPSEISRKGNRYEEKLKKLHICIVNSLRGDYLEEIIEQEFDLLVIDEAHHSQAPSYVRLIKNMRSQPKILGLTATPERIDGKFIGEILGECTAKLEVIDLIADGYLADIEGYSVKTKVDLSEVDDHNGDFSIKELYKKLATEERNEMIAKICMEDLKDRKTLIFCINVKHSLEVTSLLKFKGVEAAHIDGPMDTEQRATLLKAFREGEITALCNCQLLTEGFDEPSIDGIILARPTKSRSLFNQMIGRGLRIFPGKVNCKIIDIVDNHKSLAGFNQIIEDWRGESIGSFKSIRDIKDHINKQLVSLAEYTIIRSDLLNRVLVDEIEATTGQLEYLRQNNITFFETVSFNEASFMIWHNELRKEFLSGNNKI